jgi:thiol-disulfide isomerase/thioredoxin
MCKLFIHKKLKRSFNHCLLFVFWLLTGHLGFAQSAYQLQIDAPSIGKICPDYKFNVLGHHGVKEDSISAYRGQVLILEFWATNCRPCVPAMDNFEILEASFPKQVKVLEITNEDRAKVESFLAKHATGSTIVLDTDHQLNKAFYHHLIPHTVLISPDGVVRAFTSPDQVSSQVVRQLINNQDVSVRAKHEFDAASRPVDSDLSRALDAAATQVFQTENPVLVPEPSISGPVSAAMILTEFKAGMGSEIRWESDRHVKFFNCSLPIIYQTLFDVPSSHVVLEVPSEHLLKYSFDEKNAFCLELALPKYINRSLKDFGHQQLESMFDLKAKQSTCERDIYAIQQADSASNQSGRAESGRTGTMKELLSFLENMPSNYGTPVVDESNLINAKIDMDWFVTNPESIENKLLSLGLKRVKKKAMMDCLILYEKYADKSN